VVTHFRHYFGNKISLWQDMGTLLASKTVISQPGSWQETALDTPVTLIAGTTYRIGAYVQTGNYFYLNSMGVTFAFGSLHSAYLGAGDSFPRTANSSYHWPFIDLAFQIQATIAIPIQPLMVSNFVNGVWKGRIMVQRPGANFVLKVDDSAGRMGNSAPFNSGVMLLAPVFVGSGQFRFIIQGSPGQVYVMEASENLIGWTARLTNQVDNSGQLLLVDPDAVKAGKRFYRIRVP
jgi:hypothetical protein